MPITTYPTGAAYPLPTGDATTIGLTGAAILAVLILGALAYCLRYRWTRTHFARGEFERLFGPTRSSFDELLAILEARAWTRNRDRYGDPR